MKGEHQLVEITVTPQSSDIIGFCDLREKIEMSLSGKVPTGGKFSGLVAFSQGQTTQQDYER